MSKPTETELKTALIAAQTMKEHDKDPFFLAKSLLNHDYRLKYFEDLLKAADLYMNHGQSEYDRLQLLHQIEKVRHEELRISKQDEKDFGLE